MNRRDFIKVMAGGTSVILVPSILNGCSDENTDVWLEPWKGPVPDETDIRRIVLSYAILAPNPHNIQPWIVDLTGPASIDLYVDRSRLLPETDPPARQIHISHGTFLENLELAARQYGYRANIRYFPFGEYDNTMVDDKPVASIDLVKDDSIKRDVLFDQILRRQSNKSEYDETPLTSTEIAALQYFLKESDFSLTITSEALIKQRMAEILTEAMRIETASKQRDAETIAMFRFDDEERRRYRDGFGVAQSGMSGVMKWAAESFFLSREDAEKDSTNFGEQAVDITTKQALSAAAFGWITTETNTRRDQVLCGRAYERVNLAATALGVAMHPMSQVLQEYADMTQLQKHFRNELGIPAGQTVQMLFRLGKAESVEHSPRRNIADLAKG